MLKATTPSNGIATTDTINIEVNGVDGIENILTTDRATAEETLYDLQGRKINAINMRGIYIKNGKKYIIK